MKPSDSLTDNEIFALLKQGQDAAFETIYKRYFGPLLRTAIARVRCRQEAEEITQEVFLQLYQKRFHLQNTDNLSGYLHTLLRHRLIDRIRRQYLQQKHQHFIRHTQVQHTAVAPEHLLHSKMLEQKIRGAINKLPNKCREVFVLSRLDYLPHQAIAQKLDLSVSTVEKHIVKALKVLRNEIRQE